MSNNRRAAKENPVKHFTKRASLYNRSSSWVDDPVLIHAISGLAQAGRGSCVLDIAIGTGRIAREFKGSVKRVVGVDICPAMARKARRCADTIVLSPAEKLPFKNDSFDMC
ncbi:MAG: class I SAM-dependent methyltransferase, partial [Candidatus Omnitrophica bacterium]|nr:class I SAM-dependent methyltransferase [Candidatus Omnitrophota bacterium]